MPLNNLWYENRQTTGKERMAELLNDYLYGGNNYAGTEEFVNANDWSPTGNLPMLYDAGAELGRGNYGSGIGLAALAAIPLPPAVKKIAGKVAGKAKNAVKDLAGYGVDAQAPITSAIAEKGLAALPEPAAAKPSIRAYHGSPHDFDKFTMDRIGTGQGVQSYGHGLYFAEQERVAKEIRDSLSGPKFESSFDNVNRMLDEEFARINRQTVHGGEAKDAAQVVLERLTLQERDALKAGDMEWYSKVKDQQNEVRRIAEQNPKPSGHMYEVDINADPDDFLDWDKPLSEQPQSVQGFFRKESAAVQGLKPGGDEGAILRKALKLNEGSWADIDLVINNDQQLYKQVQDIAARQGQPINLDGSSPGEWFANRHRAYLNAATNTDDVTRMSRGREQEMAKQGIPGIKYLDQGSRGKGDGTRNYVVFDDKLINIVRKYGLGALMVPAVAAGASGGGGGEGY